MLKLKRHPSNPIILPSISSDWEKGGTFNGSIVKKDENYFMAYRAMTPKGFYMDANIQLSTIGIAKSTDGITFADHFQLIKPTEDWEKYGCEDPRIVYIDDKFYIFYTAIGGYPFGPNNIKVAVAISKDLKTIDEKHLVTPFNAKAMGLFPEKIGGKYVAFLSANTDIPPAKISLRSFEKIEDLWNHKEWEKWYGELDKHTLPLLRHTRDQVEAGAVPVKTEKGWVFVYSLIRNYYTNDKVFTIEAALLDLDDPRVIKARTTNAMLMPEEEYELYGNIPNVVFPTGAQVIGNEFYVYYGAADTSMGLATCTMEDLMHGLKTKQKDVPHNPNIKFERASENPILEPIDEREWEDMAVFNPAAVYEQDKVHILYRAMGKNGMSSVGLAISKDGVHIDERLPYPIYTPREPFETKLKDGNFGCEDPRLVRLEDRFYITYTAFDGGVNPPRVAFSSISADDFLNRRWNWERPILISPPNIDDKDACIFPKKINDKYVFLHRINDDIWIDFVDDLKFSDNHFLDGAILMHTRVDHWDHKKIGIAGPPIETNKGWLLLYHGITEDKFYKVGACLLDLNSPDTVLSRLSYPVFEPEEKYELEGIVNNVVFPCGNVVIGEDLFIYYGGADKVLGVAKMNLKLLLDELSKYQI